MDYKLSLQLYTKLYRSRRAEQRIIDLYGENDMKTPMHMSFGQEAVPAAVAEALAGKGDIVTSYRTHAPFLAITGDVDAFFGELYGRAAGFAEGVGGSMHLALPERGHLISTAIVAGGISIATGAAFSHKRLKTGHIAVVFFGDGAVEEGAFWESINVASVMRLPVLFVCEDNGLAVHTRASARHGFKSLQDIIESFGGFEFAFDDSNDVELLYSKCRTLVEHCQSGIGPAFLHAQCFRYLEHVGINSDFNRGYRSKTEMDPWLSKDCLAIQRRRLVSADLESDVLAIEDLCGREIERAIAKAKASPAPQPARLNAGVFHEKH